MKRDPRIIGSDGNGLYNSGTYMLTIALGCAMLCTAGVVIARIGWAVVAWL